MDFWKFENSVSGSSAGTEATLYIYGDICFYDLEWWHWPDDVVPHRFKNDLAALGDVDTIHVRINSNGGSVFGAYAIMNLLKTHKAQIITYNDGIAASAATLIAMAGNRIVSSLGSVWMIHLPLTTVTGNAEDLKKAIEILGKITESMADIYHAKTGIDRDELMKMMNEDKWMTGKEALEKGFVDEVSGLKVEAFISEDSATAFFNGLAVELKTIRNKEAFVAMLPVKNKPNLPGKGQPQEEEITMTLAELKAKHPEVYTAAVNEGVAQSTSADVISQAKEEALKAERERIKAIDDMALPGMESLTNRAKFESGITAEQYAVEILKAQKEKGANFLAMAHEDAKGLDEVPNAGAPQDGQAEEDALLAMTAESAKNIRR